ncbi:MAG: hypothetical protein U5L73_07340 [Rhodoferax sp.]|nr:hypothetical protein [Rhodoferax sp.]MDZ7891558.1 hypothetical protein [Rhodoferax sp.]
MSLIPGLAMVSGIVPLRRPVLWAALWVALTVVMVAVVVLLRLTRRP